MEKPDALKPCPFCGASAYMANEHDPDDIAWVYIRCRGCGVRTRGKWYSAGNDCQQLRAEVRDEWNERARAAPPLPAQVAPGAINNTGGAA